MTKSILAKKISQNFPHLTADQIKQAVETFFEEINQALVEGKRIELRGLGIFSTKTHKARLARNPSNNEVIEVKERKLINYRIGKKLYDELNKKNG